MILIGLPKWLHYCPFLGNPVDFSCTASGSHHRCFLLGEARSFVKANLAVKLFAGCLVKVDVQKVTDTTSHSATWVDTHVDLMGKLSNKEHGVISISPARCIVGH
jgi:hypothetical protein